MKVLTKGFTDIYGIEWTEKQIDRYNKIWEKISKRESEGFEVENLKDYAHMIYNEPKREKELTKCY